MYTYMYTNMYYIYIVYVCVYAGDDASRKTCIATLTVCIQTTELKRFSRSDEFLTFSSFPTR